MELTIDQALQQGVAAHREGKLQDAERLYRAILQTQPNHPDANHNLGVLAVAVGKPLNAIPLFKLALETNPQIEQFWLSYIDALIKLERFEEARLALAESERAGASAEKLEALSQRLRLEITDDTYQAAEEDKLSEQREIPAGHFNTQPPEDLINRVIKHYQAGRLEAAEPLAISLTQQHPKHPFGWKALGLLFKQTGRLADSLVSMRKAVELSPHDAEAHSNLGITLQELGKLDEAEASLRKAMALEPGLAEIHSNLGMTLKELGRFDEAMACHRQAISLKPDLAEAHNNLGVTLRELGMLEEAADSYKKAIAVKSDYAEGYNNLGNTLKELGRFTESEASYRQALAIRPDYAQAYSNLGITLQELGYFDDAEASLRKAIALKPDCAAVHYNFATFLHAGGKYEEAEARYRQAIALAPDDAKAHSNLGITLKELSRLDEAEASYRHAIALQPDCADAHLNLCELLERTNDIENLLRELETAKAATSSLNTDYLYYEALAHFRKELYSEANSLLAQVNKEDVSEARRARYFKLKGDLHHHSHEFEAAFAAYEESNRIVKSGAEYQRYLVPADRYFDAQKNTARELEQLARAGPSKSTFVCKRRPVFLVGFPRSGTTLLDTILRTHSKIECVEEQPMAAKMRAALGDQSVSNVELMDDGVLSVAGASYFEELSKHVAWSNDALVIDKLPLNLLHAPMINRAFPEARFILALRHPLDCILSCWMQDFKLNAAMANMVDLDRIVDFYCVAMKVFNLSQKRYGINVHRIRYEDLIEDFEAETTSILNFLGLEWEADLVNYQATALARRKINTPSRSQVIKLIYKTASYRWKHYEKHLEKFKSQLAPWFEEYGY